jgi:hypothetical protein
MISHQTTESGTERFAPYFCEVCNTYHCDDEHPELWDESTDAAMLGHGEDN